MRRLALIVLVALVLPAPASAKELSSATICGADGCRTITDREELRGLIVDGNESLPPPAPGRFYTVELGTRDDVREYTWTIWYAPGARAIAVVTEVGAVAWHPVRGAAFERASRGLVAFPRPRVTSVRIGDRVITDGAASYLRLFTQPQGEPVTNAPLTDWTAIDLRSARPTPWTASDAEFTFSPQGRTLERGWKRITVPDWTAEAIVAGEPLTPPDSAPRLLPWLALGALAATILLVATFRRVVRAAPAPEPT